MTPTKITKQHLRRLIREEAAKIRLEQRRNRSWCIQESGIHGNGIFTTTRLREGTKVGKAAKPGSRGIYDMTRFGNLINHRSDPNCELRLESDNCYWLYTLVDMAEGAELVSNYRDTPHHHINSFLGFVER